MSGWMLQVTETKGIRKMVEKSGEMNHQAVTHIFYFTQPLIHTIKAQSSNL
jgi:hypothetical protein